MTERGPKIIDLTKLTYEEILQEGPALYDTASEIFNFTAPVLGLRVGYASWDKDIRPHRRQKFIQFSFEPNVGDTLESPYGDKPLNLNHYQTCHFVLRFIPEPHGQPRGRLGISLFGDTSSSPITEAIVDPDGRVNTHIRNSDPERRKFTKRYETIGAYEALRVLGNVTSDGRKLTDNVPEDLIVR